MLKRRITRGGRTTIPAPVCEALGLAPGKSLIRRIEGDRVVLARAEPAAASADDDPFACFDEWASAADRAGYAGL